MPSKERDELTHAYGVREWRRFGTLRNSKHFGARPRAADGADFAVHQGEGHPQCPLRSRI
jgi:hypothetical protein